MRYLLAALGKARCPIAIDQVFAGKNRHRQLLDLTLRCQSRERLRRPWKSGVPGARSRPLAGKTSRRWVPYCGLTPPCFFGHGCGPEPRQPTIDAGEPAEPQRRQRADAFVPSSRSPIFEEATRSVSNKRRDGVRRRSDLWRPDGARGAVQRDPWSRFAIRRMANLADRIRFSAIGNWSRGPQSSSCG